MNQLVEFSCHFYVQAMFSSVSCYKYNVPILLFLLPVLVNKDEVDTHDECAVRDYWLTGVWGLQGQTLGQGGESALRLTTF